MIYKLLLIFFYSVNRHDAYPIGLHIPMRSHPLLSGFQGVYIYCYYLIFNRDMRQSLALLDYIMCILAYCMYTYIVLSLKTRRVRTYCDSVKATKTRYIPGTYTLI